MLFHRLLTLSPVPFDRLLTLSPVPFNRSLTLSPVPFDQSLTLFSRAVQPPTDAVPCTAYVLKSATGFEAACAVHRRRRSASNLPFVRRVALSWVSSRHTAAGAEAPQPLTGDCEAPAPASGRRAAGAPSEPAAAAGGRMLRCPVSARHCAVTSCRHVMSRPHASHSRCSGREAYHSMTPPFATNNRGGKTAAPPATAPETVSAAQELGQTTGADLTNRTCVRTEGRRQPRRG